MNFDNYRRILHLDLDAFFASVEQRDNPSLQGKAIAVGLNSARGVVASASYEARKFGVRSAMPSSVAARLCPNLIFVPGRMDEYKKASAEVFEIFSRYTNLIEQVSIDEAFLDVTDVWRDYGYAISMFFTVHKIPLRLLSKAAPSFPSARTAYRFLSGTNCSGAHMQPPAVQFLS